MSRPLLAAGPLSMLFCSIAAAAGAIGIEDARTGALCVALSVAAVGWLVADARGAAFRLSLGLIAALSLFASSWLYGGHHLDESLGTALRIVYLVFPAAVLGARIRPSELADHLAQRAGLPDRVAVSAAAALGRIDSIGETWRQITRARRARGMGIDGGVVRRLRASAGAAFGLLVASMRHAGALAVAMDARGFAHATQRTWAQPAPWLRGDWVVAAIGVALAAAPWFLR
jgi:energy-coupling factor transporter transmembrane protein EcfT